jgi:hypothetical protein
MSPSDDIKRLPAAPHLEFSKFDLTAEKHYLGQEVENCGRWEVAAEFLIIFLRYSRFNFISIDQKRGKNIEGAKEGYRNPPPVIPD